MTDDDPAFLARWSRRKRATAEPAPPEPAPPEDAAGRAGDRAPPVALPDVASLGKDSDYTAFLREGVPRGLRRAALRKLWRSDPALANLDGLNDYDEDFTQTFAEVVTRTVKTAYRVGKGLIDEAETAPEGPAEAATETPLGEASESDEPDDGGAPPAA